MSKSSIEVVTGVQKRRRWSPIEKKTLSRMRLTSQEKRFPMLAQATWYSAKPVVSLEANDGKRSINWNR